MRLFCNSKDKVFYFRPALILILVFGLLATGCTDYRTYKKAEQAIEQEDFEKAFQLLEEIPDYKDSNNIRNAAVYGYAKYLENVKRFDEAVELYERIPDYENSQKRTYKVYLAWAERLTAMGEHAQALEIYKKIGEENRALQALLRKADNMINQADYIKAIESLKGLGENPEAKDLITTAETGAMYLKGIAALDRNDFTTARKIFEKAVKIKHEKRMLFEPEYLKRYCEGLKPVMTRMGGEGNYVEVLKAGYPVLYKIRHIPSPDCQDCIKVLNVAADRYFYKETNSSAWHQEVDSYRKSFDDITARCSVYGGLFNQHLQRTGRLINVLKASELIGDECNNSQSEIWEDAVKKIELNLSTMVLEWKKTKNYKQIIILQKYVTKYLEGLELDLEKWGTLQESDILPNYKFNSTHIGGNKHMVAGWISNPSKYRPMLVKGVNLDCLNETTSKVDANCTFVKFNEQVLPGVKRTLNARVSIPSGPNKINGFSIVFEFEDVHIKDVKAEDIFQ